MQIIQSVEFLIVCAIIGIGLFFLYSRHPKKYQRIHEVTKAVWAVVGAVVVVIEFCTESSNLGWTMAVFAVVLALLEGLPVLIRPFIKVKDE